MALDYIDNKIIGFLRDIREFIRDQVRAELRTQQAPATAEGVRKIVREEFESRNMMSGTEWIALKQFITERVVEEVAARITTIMAEALERNLNRPKP